MNQIKSYLYKYWSTHFHLRLYLTTAIFLAICIFLNFTYDLEKDYVHAFGRTHLRWFLMFVEMGFPFLCICGFLYLFDVNRSWVKSREFWLLFVFGFVVISFQRTLFYHHQFFQGLDYVDLRFYKKVFWRLRSMLTTFLPLMLFYIFYERKRDAERSWYGLTLKQTDFRPYALLVLLVFVGIWVASYISELSTYYPRYLKTGGAAYAKAHGFEEWIAVAIYELSYGSSFLSVELFFRGFLVMGFMRVLGGHAVLAMVGSYVFLHFGKPVTECISSAFGGYLLGILTFYSKRIWGGVILHVALAWSMELFAWWQRWLAS